MDFLGKDISKYIEAHTFEESDVLKKLNRETYTRILKPRMLSGHFQGRLLAMISNMINPETILEIGTYTGYSAICLAEGLKEGGRVHTIDINEELEEMAGRFFKEAGVSEKIIHYVGDALEVVPKMNITFDLVFIDADKINYINYYNIVFEKVKKGGYIIADNVLWSGKVISKGEKLDKDTNAIMEFNDLVHQDHRVENVLLPVRDGLMILRKK